MRIMQIVSGRGVNGAVIHCLMLARALAARGHEITLVCRPGAWIGEQQVDGIEVFPSTLDRWPFAELRRVAAAARERQIEVVQTHMSRAHFFGVLLRWFGGTPSVATAHCRKVQLHWALNDRVIAVSEATARFHHRVNFVPKSKMEVVYNFLDDQRFSTPSPAVRLAARAQLGLKIHHIAIGTVGDVCARKGQLYLIQAMPELLRQVPEARLLLIGGGHPKYVAECEREAEQLGVTESITFCGHRSDVRDLLEALDIYTLASVEESFPLSALEAMAAGLPLVTTTAGGLPECVVNGETGFLVRPRDPAALAEALIEVASDISLRSRFGASGQIRARTHFSSASQTPRIEAALARAARRRAA
jgi:glycosyltransferase involved in cell wall biosynthesis